MCIKIKNKKDHQKGPTKDVTKNKHEAREGVLCEDPILVALKVTSLAVQEPISIYLPCIFCAVTFETQLSLSYNLKI
jgi:hypothetical protein